jgi:hypothetical protein
MLKSATHVPKPQLRISLHKKNAAEGEKPRHSHDRTRDARQCQSIASTLGLQSEELGKVSALSFSSAYSERTSDE